jgi:hypothetical protein
LLMTPKSVTEVVHKLNWHNNGDTNWNVQFVHGKCSSKDDLKDFHWWTRTAVQRSVFRLDYTTAKQYTAKNYHWRPNRVTSTWSGMENTGNTKTRKEFTWHHKWSQWVILHSQGYCSLSIYPTRPVNQAVKQFMPSSTIYCFDVTLPLFTIIHSQLLLQLLPKVKSTLKR